MKEGSPDPKGHLEMERTEQSTLLGAHESSSGSEKLSAGLAEEERSNFDRQS